jgi:hypothetical protein
MGDYTAHLDPGHLGGVYAGSPEFRGAIAEGQKEFKLSGMPAMPDGTKFAGPGAPGTPSTPFVKPNITPGSVPGFGGAPSGAAVSEGGLGGLNLSEGTKPKFMQEDRFVQPDTRLQERLAGDWSSRTIDRANGNVTSTQPSSVNLDVRHDGSKATAKVASSKGPAFADTKVKTTPMQKPRVGNGTP